MGETKLMKRRNLTVNFSMSVCIHIVDHSMSFYTVHYFGEHKPNKRRCGGRVPIQKRSTASSQEITNSATGLLGLNKRGTRKHTPPQQVFIGINKQYRTFFFLLCAITLSRIAKHSEIALKLAYQQIKLQQFLFFFFLLRHNKVRYDSR